MSVGDDIKEALAEVGATYTIVRSGEAAISEVGLLEYSSQVTKPITIEHFRRCTAPYDTQMVTGDIVNFSVVNENYIVTNVMKELFENAAVQADAVLYKCNVSGKLLRPSGETWDNNLYHKETQWEVVATGCRAMQVAALYGNELSADEELALIGLKKDEVVIPHSTGVQVLDRWEPYSGEFYSVSTIEARRYPNVDVLIVEEDNR
jgi:hypothetical protein